MARADVVIGADGPKFVEINVSGAVGGMADTQAYRQGWRRIAGQAGRAPFAGVDIWARLAALVERTCAELGAAPSAVIVDHFSEIDQTNTPRTMRLQVDGLAAHGVRARHLDPVGLLAGIGLPGPLREPLGLAEFDLADARAAGCDLSPVRAALDAGFLTIPSQTSWLLHSKKTLAWLSEGRPWMSPRERELARSLPAVDQDGRGPSGVVAGPPPRPARSADRAPRVVRAQGRHRLLGPGGLLRRADRTG